MFEFLVIILLAVIALNSLPRWTQKKHHLQRLLMTTHITTAMRLTFVKWTKLGMRNYRAIQSSAHSIIASLQQI
ncbi:MULTISPECIES: hypothetical protein [Brucella]|uniref:Uncharacterized protein n=16 Tax=Brucella TaxID=234 RepID=Q2YQ87_BRUA2|nr:MULTISPECIES: hypothetical protein [Brucella]ERT85083.1 hypothetical protein P050_00245 [Brucella abortus 90-12178]ERT98412.1 hypothetical protein P038_02267 [Brucella abortus 99-9971-135]ERU00956.1 hypothetical protein P039_02671 [Brucella abortus 07-0994-2411]KEY01236.1 hypothetical protein IL60_0206895 [Brucella inopinata BO1]AAL52177.1 hypothetical protein BMEI0996 [Brucella melitensis bv. 1 str. 16M]